MVGKYFVAFRHPKSLLNDDWALMGSAPTMGYDTEEEANSSAIKLAEEMYYDTAVVFMSDMYTQEDSRQKP